MFDWVQAKTLRDEVGHDSFEEIIDIFVEEVEDVIGRLRTTPDLGTLGDDLHFLKSSAMNLGFAAFSTQCQLGESASAAGQAASVDLPAILASYDSSKAQFFSDLPSALDP